MKAPKLELVDLDSLEAHPENPNQGDVGAICDLIVHNGWFGQTLVQVREGLPDRVFVGEHRWRALRLLQTQGGVVRENGTETPADYPALMARAEALDLPALPPVGKCWVQRYAISDRLARRHMLADNRASDLSTYDDSQLVALLKEIAEEEGLVGTGFDDEALDELLRDLAANEARPKASDEAGPVPDDPITQPGDLITLGDHRLLCADATDASAYERLLGGMEVDLIYTDPPYGVSVVKGGMVGADFGVAKKGQYRPVIGDEGTKTAVAAYMVFREMCGRMILWGGNYYADNLPASGSWLVWDKRSDSGIENTFADAELAWTSLGGPTRVYRQLWNGMIREGEHGARVHPTQKPIGLAEWALGHFCDPDAAVLDSFAGSGSTLMACESIGRRCYAIEIDPGYCDVIVARWEKHTGQKAERP